MESTQPFISPSVSPVDLDAKGVGTKHEIYKEREQALKDLMVLYTGGYNIRNRAAQFLRKRPKEQKDIYAERQQRFTYQNVLASGMGWYESAMFRDPIELLIRENEATLPDDRNDFWTGFATNCNRGGVPFVDFLRGVFRDMLLYQRSFVLTDLPTAGNYLTAADQKAAGALTPYLVKYDALDAINWDTDANGNLNWIVFQTLEADRVFGQAARLADKWYYFDKQEFQVWQSIRKDGQGQADDKKAVMIDTGKHALAEFGRVPVRVIEVPDVLWIANRVYPQLLDHLNQDNSFSWALFMANLPIPVITGEYENNLAISETAYIQLEENGKFEWSEPKGTSFEHSAKRLDSLREEIYRQMYLLAQGKSSTATASAASGLSKQQDMMPSQDVLAGLANIMRAGAVGIYQDVADACGQIEVKMSVQGWDFEDNDVSLALADLDLATDLNIPSDTLYQVLYKDVARKLAKSEPPETRDKIEAEIEAAPTRSEIQQQQAQQQQQTFAQSLTKATGRFVAGGAVDALKAA